MYETKLRRGNMLPCCQSFYIVILAYVKGCHLLSLHYNPGSRWLDIKTFLNILRYYFDMYPEPNVIVKFIKLKNIK